MKRFEKNMIAVKYVFLFFFSFMFLVVAIYGIWAFENSRPVNIQFQADCRVAEWELLPDGKFVFPHYDEDLNQLVALQMLPDDVQCSFKGEVAGPRSVLGAVASEVENE